MPFLADLFISRDVFFAYRAAVNKRCIIDGGTEKQRHVMMVFSFIL